MVKMMMKGLKRKDGQERQVHRAKPITLPMLEQAYQLLESDASLRTWRTVWRMIICYFCFLRFDDIKRVKVSLSFVPNEKP